MKKSNHEQWLYRLTPWLCAVAWAWIAWGQHEGASHLPTVCPSRLLCGLPCPGCGASRAMELLFQGKWTDAFLMNANAYLIAVSLITASLAWIADICLHTSFLERCYKWVNHCLQCKWVWIPLVVVETIVWAVNVGRMC